MFDGRPNGELILATGRVEDDSPSDYLTISVGLVQADRMYSTKKEILKAMGFEGVQVGFLDQWLLFAALSNVTYTHNTAPLKWVWSRHAYGPRTISYYHQPLMCALDNPVPACRSSQSTASACLCSFWPTCAWRGSQTRPCLPRFGTALFLGASTGEMGHRRTTWPSQPCARLQYCAGHWAPVL